ncbi:MAG: UDP-N-acetylmuramoyl-tripeptide--D-alanyl-D-alanine ligase [Thiogranum sp.]|nr:UDP-N-acetylmuramoyl-tripeptide--D-alanyl-D-alanine ligase [Thiogranum sp.]
MVSLSLSQAAQVLGARQRGDDISFRGVSTDTRTLSEGNLFVALQGPNFDGHDYLQQALACGAAGAVVSRAPDLDLPALEVPDTRIALGQLAAYWRSRFSTPCIAITGSNGKTSVKEMLASILSGCGETLVTRGNLNNDIGVPLTLFRLGSEHRYAVIEMGANHAGEIAYLTSLAQPQVGVVNNAGPAHLEGFGDLAGVAEAKGELFSSMHVDSVCVINADDQFAARWRELAGARPVKSFGLEAPADVSADWRGDINGSDIELRTPAGTANLHLPLPGRHNVMNALAATAAALALNVPLQAIVTGLASVQPVHGRWEACPGINGMQLIDDTYNANPGSLHAALQLLAGAGAETWLVLGDMGELGASGAALHREVGAAAAQLGVRRLFALGTLAEHAAQQFGAGAEVCSDMNDLISRLRDAAQPDVVMLVKGSRSMRMERVIEALRYDAAEDV